MKTVRIKVYKFNELNEKAQQKALLDLCYINVEYDWWQFTYDDAKTIGLKITGFDIDRGNYCEGELMQSLSEVCYLIFENHGEHCETYKTAKAYLAEWAKLVKEHSDGVDIDKVSEDKEYEFDELADELEEQFRMSLCEDYKIILQHEYEYLTSEEAIKETIIANEYDFTADGKLF